MTVIASYLKSPTSTKDYPIDLAPYLKAGEKCVAASYSVNGGGLTVGAGAYAPTIDADGKGLVVWLQGGTAGVSYDVTVHITTDNVPPRIDDRTIAVNVEGVLVQYIPPEYSVFGFGAVGDGIADDTIPIGLAISAANDKPGTVHFGADHRITAQPTPITGRNVFLVGRGDNSGGTILRVDSPAPIDALLFQGAAASGVSSMLITGSRVYTSGFAVKFDSCVKCHADDVTINHLGGGYFVYRSLVTRVHNADIRSIFGSQGVLYAGTSSANCHQLLFTGTGNMDNPPPGSVDGHPGKLYTNLLAVTPGDTILANGNIYYCSAGGTTAAAGSGPSGVPSTDPNSAYSTTVVDGSATFLYMGALCTWVEQREWSNTINFTGSMGLLNGGYGVRMINTDGAAGSTPTNMSAYGLACDHNWGNGIQLTQGADVSFYGLQALSTVFGSAVRIDSTFSDGYLFSGGRVFGASEHGFLVAQGQGEISSMLIGSNGGRAANSYDGVNVAAGVSDFGIRGGASGVIGGIPSSQRYGVNLLAGASDHYTIRGVRVRGNLTGGVNDGGAGANKDVGGNPV